MAQRVFKIDNNEDYRRAGPGDLIELNPAPGSTPLFIMKSVLEILTCGIICHEFIHLSGPTGSAKSSLIEALARVPGNFKCICEGIGQPFKPLKFWPIEMATFDAPGELYQRRSLKDGCTFDEESKLVEALRSAETHSDTCYPLIWLREMGRVHSSSVQGGLLNLMTKSDIILPGGDFVQGRNISWIADSNYQAEQDSTYTLVVLDEALKRRFTLNITLDYLTAEQEVEVMMHLSRKLIFRNQISPEMIMKTVELGQILRQNKSQGKLLSLPAPTIHGYLALLRIADNLPHLTFHQIAMSTLLGNASKDDWKHLPAVFNKVFGLQVAEDGDFAVAENLF